MRFEHEEVQREYDQFCADCLAGSKNLRDFDNFITRLPYTRPMGGARAGIEESLPHLLKTKSEDERASALRRSQTLGEFYATVDETLREEGVFDQVKAINHVGTPRDELYALAYPTYFRLRDKGYKQYPDLTS